MKKTKDGASMLDKTRPDELQVLTVQEVADLLRVHRSTVSRYAMSGEIRSYRIGNRRLFKVQDVRAFFENQVAQECVTPGG